MDASAVRDAGTEADATADAASQSDGGTGDAGMPDGVGESCTHEDDCPDTLTCVFGEGSCGDPGTCQQPEPGGICTSREVCGCDGQTYNQCSIPVRKKHDGAC
jgi:hypothetical protein